MLMVNAYTNEIKENDLLVDEMTEISVDEEKEPSKDVLSFIEHFAHSLYSVGAERGLKGIVISLN